MGKMKKSKRRDLDKDYALCCGCCPLCKKRGPTLTEEIVEGVMKKLGHPPRVIEEYICPVRKCVVNPMKPRSCGIRDRYFLEHGMKPMGMLDGIREPAPTT